MSPSGLAIRHHCHFWIWYALSAASLSLLGLLDDRSFFRLALSTASVSLGSRLAFSTASISLGSRLGLVDGLARLDFVVGWMLVWMVDGGWMGIPELDTGHWTGYWLKYWIKFWIILLD